MFDYDIVPSRVYTDNPRYIAKRVKRGTGRYHTMYQARRVAGELRGRERDSIGFRFRNVDKNRRIGERMTERIIRQAIRAALKSR